MSSRWDKYTFVFLHFLVMGLSISLANWWFSEINLVPGWEEKSLDFFSKNVLTTEVNPCWYASYREILSTANALSDNTPLETVLTVLCTYYKPNHVEMKVLLSSFWYMHPVSPISLNFCILYLFFINGPQALHHWLKTLVDVDGFLAWTYIEPTKTF